MQGLPHRTEIERCYRILELDPESSSRLVDASWRKLVDEWRPDRFFSDPLLHARAVARVNHLNCAYELVKRHLASQPDAVAPISVPKKQEARSRWSFPPRLATPTVFGGLALAAVLFAGPLSSHKLKPAAVTHTRDTPAALTASPVVAPRSDITLVAHAPLVVSVALIEDGRILLPETTLYAGQSTTVTRLGPTYVRYSSGENLEIEIDGHRYAMPTKGPSRARIN